MAMKPRAMKKKMMRGGAVKKPAAKMMRGGSTGLPVGLPKISRKSNTEAFNDRTNLNKKAQTARAAGPAVNAATAKKRANAAAALKRKRANAEAALERKRTNAVFALKRKRTNASKPVVKKPSKSAPTPSGPIATTMGPRIY